MTLLKKWKLIVVVKYSRLATTIQKVNLERMRFCKIKTKSLSRWVNKNLELFWFAVFGSAMYVNHLPKAILRIFFILRTRVIDTLTGLSTMFCITQRCLYRNADYETKGMKVWWDCHNPGQGWRWEVIISPRPPTPQPSSKSAAPTVCPVQCYSAGRGRLCLWAQLCGLCLRVCCFWAAAGLSPVRVACPDCRDRPSTGLHMCSLATVRQWCRCLMFSLNRHLIIKIQWMVP